MPFDIPIPMNPSIAETTVTASRGTKSSRLDYLDATRAFALVLGILFHACLSFVPVYIGWAVQDISTSPMVAVFMTVSHSFRMETFFLLAGFLSHQTFHRKGARDFIRARLLRIGVPFVVGWFILHPLVISGWIMGSASLHGHVDIGAGLRGGFQSLSTLPNGLLVGSHLWFLYYLVLITVPTVAVRELVKASGSWHAVLIRRADSVVAWLAISPVSPMILAIPTASALWFMRYWSIDTPDQSLVPELPSLVVYSSFFLLGWMLNREDELIPQITRLSWSRWMMSGLGITTVLLLGEIERDPGHPYYRTAHVAYAAGYALTMWSLTFLMIGILRKLFSRPNGFVRYIADSSYWMYLLHLPVVVWLQVAVAELPLHWSLKLAFISSITIGLSLFTYDLVVRSTFIGWILHGRRRERVIAPWILTCFSRQWNGMKSAALRPREGR